jgi:pimeloyl-ACP methyl ester carboxylesterase
VFVGILQGLEEAYRITIPMLDIFGERDWDVTRWGAEERRKQIERVPGSRQVMVPRATHFFEGQEEDLIRPVAGFLDGVFQRR